MNVMVWTLLLRCRMVAVPLERELHVMIVHCALHHLHQTLTRWKSKDMVIVNEVRVGYDNF